MARSVLAATSRPLVSLSSRCTMPGRATPPMPESGAAMGDQRIDQGAVGIAGRRMHHQAGRLVDHDQVVVFIDDLERNILALRQGGAGGGTVTS